MRYSKKIKWQIGLSKAHWEAFGILKRGIFVKLDTLKTRKIQKFSDWKKMKINTGVITLLLRGATSGGGAGGNKRWGGAAWWECGGGAAVVVETWIRRDS